MNLILSIVAAIIIVQLIPVVLLIAGIIAGHIFLGFLNVITWATGSKGGLK